MATFRSDINSIGLNSNFSTSRLLNENDTTTKYNQFKRNVNNVNNNVNTGNNGTKVNSLNSNKSQDYSNYNTNSNYNNFSNSNHNISNHNSQNYNNTHYDYNNVSNSRSNDIHDRETADSDKFINLKMLYDERIKGLYQEVKLTVQKLGNDEILQTMKKDAISSEYISQRINEVIDENLHMEKEETIKRLNEDLAESKSKINLLELNNNDLSNRLKNISEEYDQKINDYEEKLFEYQKSQELFFT